MSPQAAAHESAVLAVKNARARLAERHRERADLRVSEKLPPAAFARRALELDAAIELGAIELAGVEVQETEAKQRLREAVIADAVASADSQTAAVAEAIDSFASRARTAVTELERDLALISEAAAAREQGRNVRRATGLDVPRDERLSLLYAWPGLVQTSGADALALAGAVVAWMDPAAVKLRAAEEQERLRQRAREPHRLALGGHLGRDAQEAAMAADRAALLKMYPARPALQNKVFERLPEEVKAYRLANGIDGDRS